MKTSQTQRWLLPFTHGVDMRAIDCAVRLAESAGAILIPVSFVSVSTETKKQGARLEHIQQSNDFLEAVQYKAELYHVPVERYEVYTADVLQSITTIVHEMHCDGMLLVTGGEQAWLLRSDEVKRLLTGPPTTLVLVRLAEPGRLPTTQDASGRFFSWLRKHWRQPDAAGWQQGDEVSGDEEPLWVRTEQHHLG